MKFLTIIALFSTNYLPKSDFIGGKWTNEYDNAIIEFIKEDKTFSARLLKPAKGY